jgi:hypothetical protein
MRNSSVRTTALPRSTLVRPRLLLLTFPVTNNSIVEEVEEVTNSADLKNALNSKGSIKLSFRFVTNVRRSSRPHTESLVDILPVMAAVPEKALKGDARSRQATLVMLPLQLECSL